MKKIVFAVILASILASVFLYKHLIPTCKNITKQQAIQIVQHEKNIQTASFLALDNKNSYSVKVGENRSDSFHTNANYEVGKCSGVIK